MSENNINQIPAKTYVEHQVDVLTSYIARQQSEAIFNCIRHETETPRTKSCSYPERY